MDSVTQDMRFRQSLLKYSDKYGVTKAAISKGAKNGIWKNCTKEVEHV